MKRKVYDYIAVNPRATVQMCAKGLKVGAVIVLALIEELCKDGVVSRGEALPLGNSIDPDNSTFYSVCAEYGRKKMRRNSLARKYSENQSK